MNYELKTQNWRRRRPGVTLVEILIGLVLLSAVSFFVYSIFSAQLSLFFTQITGIDVSSQNKIAIEDLTNQTRQAESIVLACPSCEADEITDNNSVVYRLSGLDSNGEPTPSYYDYMVYKQVGTNLVRSIYITSPSTRKTESNKIIATDLLEPNGLSFSYNTSPYDKANLVTFTITTKKTANTKTQSITQTGTARIRNQGITSSNYLGTEEKCGSTSIDNLNVPFGTQNGDLMLLFVASNDNETGTPSGLWIPIGPALRNSDILYGQISTTVYYKVADNEISDYNITGFTDDSDPCAALSTFKNVNTSGNPIDSFTPTENSPSTIISADSVTTIANKTEVVFLFAVASYLGNAENFSGSNPAFTKRFEESNIDIAIAGASGEKTGAGPTQDRTADFWDNDPNLSNAYLIALKLN